MEKRIVIVDDSDFKTEKIKEALNDIFNNTRIVRFKTYNEAIRFIYDNQDYIDFIVLDWVFPRFTGVMPSLNMGEEVLKQMYEYDISVNVIICSSCDVRADDDNVIGTILYDDFSPLKEKFVNIIGQENIDKANEGEVKKRTIKK